MHQIKSVAVVIPTRSDPNQNERLERALHTVFNQDSPQGAEITVYLGLDPNADVPSCAKSTVGNIVVAEATQPSQAAALNACVRATTEDLIMFLEDDDFWEQGYLTLVLNAYKARPGIEMTTSNQLEVSEHGEVIRVNDFATPSSWSITRQAQQRIGLLDESYHYHLDNEYLGRASSMNTVRLHLVERTAPITLQASKQVRPWIHNIMALSGHTTFIARHAVDTPYVIRTVRDDSRSKEAEDPAQKQRSTLEYGRLVEKYGRIPW